jgi:hypothetical protein
MNLSDVLILNTTREGDPACSAGFNKPLQAVLARYLSISVQEIEQVWSAVNLLDTRPGYVPAQPSITSLTSIERELTTLDAALAQQGTALRGQQMLIVVDDEILGCSSVIAALAIQVYKRTHVEPLIIGVQETAPDAWRVVDAIPDRKEMEDWSDEQTAVFLQLLGKTGDTIDRVAFSILQQVKGMSQLSPISPPFDVACAALEELYVDAQETLAELLATTQLLPIHAVVTQLIPHLPVGMDEQALWEVECLARRTYAQSRVLSGDSVECARRSAFDACIRWALQRYGGDTLLALPDEVVRLIECVLEQVGHWFYRRKGKEQQL